MKAEEKIAQEALLEASNKLLGDKRGLLERKKEELKGIEEKHADIFNAATTLRNEIGELTQEIRETENLVRDVRDTKKVKRSSSSTCVV